MNIQKIMVEPDQQGALATREDAGLGAMAMMALPEVAAPRANPLAMIARRWVVLATVLGVCLVTAIAVYLMSPRIYRSEARLFVQVSGRGAPEPVGAGKLQTQCELIKSASVLSEVLGDPEVTNLKTFADPSGSRWATLRDNLLATVGKDNDIITVSFDAPYPKEARAVLESVVAAYTSYHTKEKDARVADLERWRGKTQGELERKQKELLEFKKANGAISFTGEKGNITLQKLATLQEALTQAHLETLNVRSQYDSISGKLADPDEVRKLVEYLRATGAAISTDGNEQALRKQTAEMEQQLEALRMRYLPDHPAVRAAEAGVAAVRTRLADMDRALARTHLVALEQRVAAAKNREAELQRSFDEQNKAATQLNARAAELEMIEGDVKRLAAAVEQAERRAYELRSSASLGVPTIQVFDRPSNPGGPIKPVRNVLLFQGLLAGLLLGCVAALVRDLTDQGLRSTEEINHALGVQVLGSVPHIAGPPNPMASGRKVDLEPASDVAETYRTIRTAVFFGTPERESRTILVTSPSAGEGKSTFASNLAIAMAQTGKRVLLVDCDFRRPVQHRVFECRTGVGLSCVLMGKEGLEHAIQPTGIAGLDLLPAGPIPSNPAEMLNSQAFTEVLEDLSVRYEHVVVDSGAVMGEVDARILAALCSVTVLVLRAQSSTRKAALHARNALAGVGAHLLGVVVNDVPRRGDRYGEYGGNASAYRARHHAAGGYPPAAPPASSSSAGAANGNRSSAIIPAQSFLDLRRK